jgi:hypothetical protein
MGDTARTLPGGQSVSFLARAKDGSGAEVFIKKFCGNPIGTEIDPDYRLERLRKGEDPAGLLKPGVGTLPGTKAQARPHMEGVATSTASPS